MVTTTVTRDHNKPPAVTNSCFSFVVFSTGWIHCMLSTCSFLRRICSFHVSSFLGLFRRSWALPQGHMFRFPIQFWRLVNKWKPSYLNTRQSSWPRCLPRSSLGRCCLDMPSECGVLQRELGWMVRLARGRKGSISKSMRNVSHHRNKCHLWVYLYIRLGARSIVGAQPTFMEWTQPRVVCIRSQLVSDSDFALILLLEHVQYRAQNVII